MSKLGGKNCYGKEKDGRKKKMEKRWKEKDGKKVMHTVKFDCQFIICCANGPISLEVLPYLLRSTLNKTFAIKITILYFTSCCPPRKGA
jgi:hypothetical protein